MFELLVYMITMAITPGPNTILSMANAATVGLKKGIGLNVGMLIGITAVTALSWIASELLYSYIPKAEAIMKTVAFVYLIILALKMLRKSKLETEAKSASLLEGMLLQLVNVKVYLLALTAIAAYIMPESESMAETALKTALIPIICFVSGLVWALGGAVMKSFYAKHRRFLSIVFAALLVWCAFKAVL